MATVDNEVKTPEKKTSAKEKMVEIRVPRGEFGGPNYMIVGLNGKYYKLKRGEVVSVPAGIAKIIEEAEANADKAREYLDSLANK